VFLPGTTIGVLSKERDRRAIRARFAYFLPPALIGGSRPIPRPP
jgi:hypothetical protein